jgi:hypothetical protein
LGTYNFIIINYSICIYIGKENKISLEYCWSLFNEELYNLKTNGYVDPENTYWNVEFFMSADWKFMQLVHGIKAPTAEYFCLYCNCSKSQSADMELQWSNDYNSKTKSNYLNLYVEKNNYIRKVVSYLHIKYAKKHVYIFL